MAKTARRKAQDVRSNHLATLLQELRATERESTIQHQARNAGVSPKALIAIANGTFGLKAVGRSKVSLKQRVGAAQTLARITEYVNRRMPSAKLPIETVLRHYGFDANDNEALSAARQLSEIKGGPGFVSDGVLKQIALRGNRVHVGLFRWVPFFNPGESMASSWAGKYSRQLINSINPLGWEFQPFEAESFSVAVDTFLRPLEILGERGSVDYDVVFPLYDTPYRRLRGLQFVHLPGLGVPLSLVSHGGASPLGWEEFATVRARAAVQPIVAVFRGEIGHLFLGGSGIISQENLRFVPRRANASEAARWLAGCVADHPTRDVVLCAGRPNCRWLLEAAEPSTTSDKGRSLRISPPSGPLAPIYRIGFGLRADAEQWFEILRHTQIEERFRNSIGQTAREYAQLLSATDNLGLLPLEPDLPEYLRSRFAVSCLDELSSLLGIAASDDQRRLIEARISEIELVWRRPS